MAEETPAGPGLSEAAERIRKTAQWMVVTFGAVAGVLVGGLQLTSLGDTAGDDRTDALVGYGLAIGGVLLAVLAAAVTLTAGRRSLHDLKGEGGNLTLRKHLNEMEDLRGGFASVSELVTKTNEAIRSRTVAWLAWRSNKADASKKQALDDAVAQTAVLVPIVDRLLDVASFEHIRRTWAVCRVLVVLGAIVAATGVAIFAANAAEPDDPGVALAPKPALGEATLTRAGLDAHRAVLGQACRREGIRVVVTGADEKAYSLVVVPTVTNRCGPASISLKRAQGSVRAASTVSTGR